MSERMPTLEEVRERFIDGFPMDTWAVSRDECGRDFDAWLSVYTAEKQAEAEHEALGRAIQAHRTLHPTYGSTAGCGGGIGGMVLTHHCAVVCDNPAHETAVDAWHQIEVEYFERAQRLREQATNQQNRSQQ